MKIFLDENLPPQLARALNVLQEALNHKNGTSIQVVSMVDAFGRGVKDEDWIPQVSNGIVITQDFRIQTTRHLRDLYQEYDVCMVFVKAPSKKGLSFWDFTKHLIHNWEQIQKIASRPKFPSAYMLNMKNKLDLLD